MVLAKSTWEGVKPVLKGVSRVVTLMSSEAAREMRLEIGSKAVAVVKATMVILETEKDAPA